MTDNVLSFDDVQSERQIGALQAGLPRVILEGQDDVKLFDKWFLHLLDQLEFIEADHVLHGAGAGCTAVGPAVQYSKINDGIPAIGIIDRDTLFRNSDWRNLFTTDDAAFAAMQTPDVITASLWEVEAYLLRPELLADWVSQRSRVMPAPDERMNGAIAASVEECEALLNLSPVLAAAHAERVAISDSWGLNHDHAALVAACETEHSAQLVAQSALVAQVRQLVDAVRSAAPAEAPRRLVFLLRYVNTKRLLLRLKSRLGLHRDSHWALPKLMSLRTLRPDELDAVVMAYVAQHAA